MWRVEATSEPSLLRVMRCVKGQAVSTSIAMCSVRKKLALTVTLSSAFTSTNGELFDLGSI